jgi:diadenosine tetraphosphate (Ap4A) HIT family hydrolase
MSINRPCPFCQLPPERITSGNELGIVVRDAYPVSPGHTLIIPRRHIGSFFDLTPEERTGLFDLLDRARAELECSHQPRGYNIGINDGPAAGQTVPHLHIHLIPRYSGDLPDPRGGVRWVMPEKARYW